MNRSSGTGSYFTWVWRKNWVKLFATLVWNKNDKNEDRNIKESFAFRKHQDQLWAQVIWNSCLGTDCWRGKTVACLLLLDTKKGFSLLSMSYGSLVYLIWYRLMKGRHVILLNSRSHCWTPVIPLQLLQSKSSLQSIFSCLGPSPSFSKRR